jgi:hypothetical protein
VIFLLFKGKPWKFFSKMKKHVGKDAYVDPGDLVVQFLNKSEAAKALQKTTQALDDFYAFILMIASNQYAENVKFEKRKA